jgi:hypothetical protein
VLLRSLVAFTLAGAALGAQAQGGRFNLDKLRETLNQLPGQAPAPASAPPAPAPATPAAVADTPAPQSVVAPAAAPATVAPAQDIEHWTMQLPPVGAASPYAVVAGLRFEAFSNPCPDGKGRCWVPIASLPLAGALRTGQEVHVTYKAGGRPWFTERMRPADATALLRDRAGAVLLNRLRSGRNQEHLARHAGRIEFEVAHVDPLANTTRKLASGHFVVDRAPGAADQADYHVAYDWATEVMTLDFTGSGNPAFDHPGLTVRAVFLQPEERAESMSLHLFHGGREIASASRWGNDWTTSARDGKTRKGHGAVGTAWALPNVVAYDRRAQKGPGFFVLGENPGEYTVKILRNGELAREAAFTVTPDGRIDRSLNLAANLPGPYTLVRAKASGTQDRARPASRPDGLWGHAAGLK